MIDFNATLFIQLANFLVLIVVLNLLLFRPLRRILKQRRDEVNGARERADSLSEKITAKTQAYEARLDEARVKGHEERAQLRNSAMEEEAKLISAAQKDAEEKRFSIKVQIADEMTEARKLLKKEADAIGQQVAAKVLGRAI